MVFTTSTTVINGITDIIGTDLIAALAPVAAHTVLPAETCWHSLSGWQLGMEGATLLASSTHLPDANAPARAPQKLHVLGLGVSQENLRWVQAVRMNLRRN